jgi:hypothetical protein
MVGRWNSSPRGRIRHSEKIRNNPVAFLAPEIQTKCEIFSDLGPANAAWVKIWDEIKAAR